MTKFFVELLREDKMSERRREREMQTGKWRVVIIKMSDRIRIIEQGNIFSINTCINISYVRNECTITKQVLINKIVKE